MNATKVACIGVGLIGQGWSTLFAWKGHNVRIYDSSRQSVEHAMVQIRSNFRLLEENGMLDGQRVDECLERIKVLPSIQEAVKDADYVQESVHESYGVKKEVFKKMDAFSPRRSILASSSSALKMSVIQKAVKNRARCLLVHPWNPVHLMPLVEIVPGKETSLHIVDASKDFMVALGKTVVVQKKEMTGTVGNRLAAALWREAIDLVGRGVANLEEIDRAVLAGPGMRWAVVGPHLSYHLAGGKGGIKEYLDHIGPTMSARWKSLAKWTSVPPSARRKLFDGIKKSEEIRGRSIEEVSLERDRKLIRLLKTFYLREE
ncbi:MAG: 3-hydroxyacyl-CoA dehydrogenase NAD-binding domain-containing protein [Nitrososphaeria archaeon]